VHFTHFHQVVEANFLSPNVYRIIANIVGDTSVDASAAIAVSVSKATVEAQTATEVTKVETNVNDSLIATDYIRQGYSGFFPFVHALYCSQRTPSCTSIFLA